MAALPASGVGSVDDKLSADSCERRNIDGGSSVQRLSSSDGEAEERYVTVV